MTRPTTSTDPAKRTIFTHYDEMRTRRFLTNEAKMAHYLPTWRNRRRRRQLATTLWVVLALMAATAVGSMFTLAVAPLWIPLTLVMCVAWTLLNLVANRQGEAPRGALDEWELSQRDSARSIGLTATQVATVLPAFVLIFGSTLELGDQNLLAYGGGGLVLTGVLFGGTLPTALIAWNRADDVDPA